jgi:hypothetical protein
MAMKYIRVNAMEDPWAGYSLDPEEYLSVLPEIAPKLPRGAREFALDEEHYNFFGRRCVKDLKNRPVRRDGQAGSVVGRTPARAEPVQTRSRTRAPIP